MAANAQVPSGYRPATAASWGSGPRTAASPLEACRPLGASFDTGGWFAKVRRPLLLLDRSMLLLLVSICQRMSAHDTFPFSKQTSWVGSCRCIR